MGGSRPEDMRGGGGGCAFLGFRVGAVGSPDEAIDSCSPMSQVSLISL